MCYLDARVRLEKAEIDEDHLENKEFIRIKFNHL